MARDLAEMEREFVAMLPADTGRDLAAWMAAIDESGAENRNAIIDWLRQLGFPFPKASWLERIHHNGGKLVYGDDSAVALVQLKLGPPARTKAAPGREQGEKASLALADDTSPLSAAPLPQNRETGREHLIPLLTNAKGLRPLAELILKEIDDIIPGTQHASAAPFITLLNPDAFAALLPQAKDIRIYADFGADTRDRTKKADSGRSGAPFPDMLVLNDARQIDDRFRDLVAKAYSRSLC